MNARKWRCLVCGYVHQGDAPPEKCPVCDADASNFEEIIDGTHPQANVDSPVKIIVVGGGIGGVTAAEAARNNSPGAEITLIHDEPGLPYSRLNLTRLIAGEIQEDGLELNGMSWYGENRIGHICDSVTGILRDSREIALKEGGRMEYDVLVLATGARPFVPPIPGAGLPGVSPLRTLAQAKDILARVSDGTKCVCIGGGLLGLELAAGLAKRGCQVTILEGSGWLLHRQLAEPASIILKAKIEALGLKVMCRAKTAEIRGAGKAESVNLESGETLDADMVLISAGVRPDITLASESGLEIGRGLKVDDGMKTSDPAIFAAGDVTEHRGVVYGLWPVAMEQGKVAGANAAGGSEKFNGVAPSTFLKVVGVDVFSIGDFSPESKSIKVIEKEENGNYVSLVVKDGRLIGANLVGDISCAVAVKSAVEKAQPIASNAKLLGLFPELRE